MSFEKLKKHKETWQKKEILRRIYLEWYKLVMSYAKQGKVVELGSGSGNLSEYYAGIITAREYPVACCGDESASTQGVANANNSSRNKILRGLPREYFISSDIIYCPWLDIVFDATAMPFEKESIDTIVMVDLLHHIDDIKSFFTEIDRVLKNKGKLIMIEPYISPFSFLVYNIFHQEAVNMHANIFNEVYENNQNQKRDPFDANEAIPTILFWRKSQFREKYPRLRIIKKQLLSFILYPLSGGFEHPSLIPLWAYSAVNLIEKLLTPLARLLAFRTFVVIEKSEEKFGQY